MPNWGTDSQQIWATEQLSRAKLPDSVSSSVQRLLRIWWELPVREEEIERVLRLFAELAQDHAIEVSEEHFEWTPVKPGYIKVADIVRVKLNAYQGDIGKRHNGRLARVVAIRSGDIIVNSIDDGPKFEGTHHSPYALDKRIPRS